MNVNRFQQNLIQISLQPGWGIKPGAFLRRARLAKGLSMRALGRMLRKDHTYLSQLERDRISPSAEMLEEICPAYGVTAWEAVAG